MASRAKTQYICSECGGAQMKWMGRCPECGDWNTLEERRVQEGGPGLRHSGVASLEAPTPLSLPEIPDEPSRRVVLADPELNRVLGGGIVPGAGILVGGDPGIGKSTLLIQTAAEVASRVGRVLYVSAEESAFQIGQRATRLGLKEERLLVLADTILEQILEQVERKRPSLVIVDSIQAIHSSAGGGAAGTVSQVRDCAALLLRQARQLNIPLFLVGHVTKEGSIAGPRVLEHMVDAVLQLEGERFHAYRLLRSVKNRFGSTNEVGVFEMTERGMAPVVNPSELFLAERLPNAAGSAIAVPLEGSRPLLVEVQALASATPFSQPRRTGNGVDFNRLLLVTAVLSKRLNLSLGAQDIFVNVIGGMRVGEPAVDLAIAAAIASSYRNVPIAAEVVLLGEVSLSGELRSVSQLSQRLREAAKLGFKRAVVPRHTLRRERERAAGGEESADGRNGVPELPDEIEAVGARTLVEALDAALVT
ncbi:MAG: DNA repair protein RadA [Caldilineaceae bacterium]|nr:DNA repair protein RadA [Caldilineaceae bacterium]MDE0183485.1 DNA repair protein RadA [Caldilineaceae bacterium]